MAQNNAPEQLERWVRPSTQPKHIDIDHPALVDIAWAADRIAELEKECGSLAHQLNACNERGGRIIRREQDMREYMESRSSGKGDGSSHWDVFVMLNPEHSPA